MSAHAPGSPPNPLPEPVVRLRGLSKIFPGSRQSAPALDQLTADIPAGQVVGVMGPDAAGKTTLMRLLAGLLRPTAGEVLVFGQKPDASGGDLHGTGGADQWQRHVGYMPQRFGLYEDLSVIDNLGLHASLCGLEGQARDAMFARLLRFTDLQRFTTRLAGKLSGGMKQKLGLACALLTMPRLLLLDEPGVGVDPLSRRELWSMVTGLATGGMSVLWSTAYMDEAARCAHVVMLDAGRIVYQGAPEDFTHRVAGRVFHLTPPHGEAREVLADWSQRSEVRDALIQGSTIRLVLAAEAVTNSQPNVVTDPAMPLRPAAPRLEDAYIDAVGGMDHRPSPFAVLSSKEEGSDQASYSMLGPTLDKAHIGLYTRADTKYGAEAMEHGATAGPIIRKAIGKSVGEAVGEAAGPVIRAMGLTKLYGSFVAAHDISFDVHPGEIFGLLGPNGAGKSTTFRMLCGLSRPTQGTCFVSGTNLLTAASAARTQLGYMAQKFSLYAELTVLGNMRLMADFYGLATQMPHKQVVQRIDQRIHAMDLQDFRTVKAGLLPLGHKQRLSMACATLHNPPVLFLDEPTSGVDPRTRREFWKHINAMTRNGVAVLVTTHFMEEAEYCDRIALIYRGGMIAQGTPDSLKAQCPDVTGQDPTLEDAFVAYVRHADGLEEPPSEAAVFEDMLPRAAQTADSPATLRTESMPVSLQTAQRSGPHRGRGAGLWLRQLQALMVKECKQIVRDVSSYMVALVLPMIFLLLFGFGITLDAGVMHIAIIDESNSAQALNLRINFSHSAHFFVKQAASRAVATQMMRDSQLDGFMVIPSDFASRLGSGQSAPIQVIVSGADPNTANFIRAYSQGVIASWQLTRADGGMSMPRPITLEPRYWFNPAATSHWYLVPGSITVVMTLIGTMLTALVIAREWERGTLEALYATPVTRMQILLGKLIPYYGLGMFSMSLCALAGVYLFQVPFLGSVLALWAISTAFLLPALGQGLLISILTREQLLAAQSGLLTAFLPAMILSGFIFDINSMPRALQVLTMAIPARHFNVSLQTIFLAGDVWSVFVPGIAYMLGLAAVFFVIIYMKLVKRLDG